MYKKVRSCRLNISLVLRLPRIVVRLGVHKGKVTVVFVPAARCAIAACSLHHRRRPRLHLLFLSHAHLLRRLLMFEHIRPTLIRAVRTLSFRIRFLVAQLAYRLKDDRRQRHILAVVRRIAAQRARATARCTSPHVLALLQPLDLALALRHPRLLFLARHQHTGAREAPLVVLLGRTAAPAQGQCLAHGAHALVPPSTASSSSWSGGTQRRPRISFLAGSAATGARSSSEAADVDPSGLENGLDRRMSFCRLHSMRKRTRQPTNAKINV
ncbi:hypothetical protein BJ912DRAFT_661416 [Pholiota molesta]|nr:hypothetical protein BJ912DRAFT_661416 [Pholiota molesta]